MSWYDPLLKFGKLLIICFGLYAFYLISNNRNMWSDISKIGKEFNNIFGKPKESKKKGRKDGN